MKRVWGNHKNIFIIVSIVIVLIIIVLIGILIGKKNSNQEKEEIEVDKLSVLTPLSYSDSAAASELIKSNIVKVLNKVGENYIIGTGFFDKSGYLITNSHIVDIKGDITVEFPNGEVQEAQLYMMKITKAGYIVVQI